MWTINDQNVSFDFVRFVTEGARLPVSKRISSQMLMKEVWIGFSHFWVDKVESISERFCMLDMCGGFTCRFYDSIYAKKHHHTLFSCLAIKYSSSFLCFCCSKKNWCGGADAAGWNAVRGYYVMCVCTMCVCWYSGYCCCCRTLIFIWKRDVYL